MKALLSTFVFILISIFAYPQSVIVDKTTADMRQILTNEVDWYGSGRDDMASLCFYSTWDEDQTFREGFKALFKHASGDFTEITCFDGKGKSKLHYFPFPIVNINIHALYYITEEQIAKIMTDPVVKIRIEYDKGYLDIDCGRKDGSSRFSDYVKKAVDVIETAKKNKTGLYDNF